MKKLINIEWYTDELIIHFEDDYHTRVVAHVPVSKMTIRRA